MTTNYINTFITASPDSKAEEGKIPITAGSIAQLQFRLASEQPYRFTSDDLLFEVHAIRNGIAEDDREAGRAAFYAKPQACLRTSPLVKQFGWGIHHDGQGRVALYGVETPAYREFSERNDLKVTPGVRSRRP